MGRPLSLDLRERIIKAWQDGTETWQEIADRFGVGIASVDRLIARYRRTGSVVPRPHGGGQPRLVDEAGEATLRELLEAQPDMTLAEMSTALEQKRGVRASLPTLVRALTRMGFTRKKSRWSPPSGRGRRSRSSEPSSSPTCRVLIPAGWSSSTRPGRTSG